MKTKLISFICFLFLFPACAYPVRYDGPYKGKIIDAETGTPIEGVVVLGVWSKVAISPGGGVSSYYDAKETLSDKNGDFEIQGLGIKILSSVTPMNVMIFKSGYQYIDGPWESHKYEGGLMKNKAKVEGDRVIFPIRKLTMEERKKNGPPTPPSVPSGKMKTLSKEINTERITIGLSPIPIEESDK